MFEYYLLGFEMLAIGNTAIVIIMAFAMRLAMWEK